MHILITGGTGFIGSHLCRHFLRQGQNNQVTVLTRNVQQKLVPPLPVRLIDSLDESELPYDLIINLAGAPLNKHRWNKKIKQTLYDSRLNTTQKIAQYIQTASIKPKLLISGSAIGFYGSSQSAVFIESSPPADTGFTHHLCDDWEKAAMAVSSYGTRVCTIRTGVVLGKGGGLLAAVSSAYKWGLGAQLGSGTQWLSWIHMDDLIGMIDHLIHDPTLEGPFNLTSAHPSTNAVFTQTLAKTLNRPCFLTLPAIFVRLIFGEMGETLLLQGQKVIPDKLIKAGYVFKFPYLDKALENILSRF